MRRRIRVVAGLIRQPPSIATTSAGQGEISQKFLVQQRLASGDRANLWEFPGGKVETGESDQEALQRECIEELEVKVTVRSKIWSTVHEYSDLTVELVLYAATILEGTPVAKGAQALRFCTPAEMAQLPFCEADVPLIDEMIRGAIALD